MVHLVPQPPGVRPDQIRRTTGDQEGMLSHLNQPAGQTPKLHPAFLWTAIRNPGQGMAREDWASRALQNPQPHNGAGLPSPSQPSVPLALLAPCLPNGTRATEKGVGKDPGDSQANAISVTSPTPS